MRKRKKVSGRKSSRMFRATASKIHPKNLYRKLSRGGIWL